MKMVVGSDTPENRTRNIIYVVVGLLLLLPVLYILMQTISESENNNWKWLSKARFFSSNFSCRQRNCNNFTFEYMISNAHACVDDDDIFVLFLVMTTHNMTEARTAVRNTWANETKYRGKTIKTIFVLGKGRTAIQDTDLIVENEKHQDIIQGQFRDTYRTLTEKVMFALGWVREYCAHVRHVIKTDDDVFHVPERYVDHLMDHWIPDRYVGGWCVTARPVRDENHKQYVSYGVYPHQYMPFYCNGGGYVMTQNAVRDIVAVAPHVQYTNMEDHFVTGLCRYATSIPFSQISGTLVKTAQPQPCTLRTWIKSTQDNVSPDQMRVYWRQRTDLRCVQNIDLQRVLILIIFLVIWFIIMFVLQSKRLDAKQTECEAGPNKLGSQSTKYGRTELC
jgi:hypothetical protein